MKPIGRVRNWNAADDAPLGWEFLRRWLTPLGRLCVTDATARDAGLNSGVICGRVAFPRTRHVCQRRDAISIPFALGFGWGGELNLEYIFEKLFCEESGQGYPKERAVPEQRNKRILDEVKASAYRPLPEILKDLDRDLVRGALGGEKFRELFFADCKCEEIAAAVREILG